MSDHKQELLPVISMPTSMSDLERMTGVRVCITGPVWIQNWRCAFCDGTDLSQAIPKDAILIKCPGLAASILCYAGAGGDYGCVESLTLTGVLETSVDPSFPCFVHSIGDIQVTFDNKVIFVNVQEVIRQREAEISEIESNPTLSALDKERYTSEIRRQMRT